MSAILFRLAPHLAVGVASFIGGCLTHWFLLSLSDAAPERLRAAIVQQRGQIRTLQADVDESRLAADQLAAQIQSAQAHLARLERERDQLQ